MNVVDTHVHVWDPATREHAWLDQLPALQRRFGVADLEAVARPCGVDQVVLVQVLDDSEETSEFLRLAGSDDFVAGVVGWLDLTAGDVVQQIAALRAGPGGHKLVGLRHLVHDEPDPAWLEREDVAAGLEAAVGEGLAFDLLVRPREIPAALAAARHLEGARLVLDHGAKPPIASRDDAAWRAGVRELARLEHVSCKISGLVTEAGPGWTSGAIRPYVEELLEWFGPTRLMFGSDWPVLTAVASYQDVVEVARTALAALSVSELENVLANTARHVYGLDVAGELGLDG
ncbi:MAG: amidohydrolase family protein [Acidimicrobiales bacterium]